MYIDSLTIAASIIVFLAFAVFIRFCMIGICGLTRKHSGTGKGERS